LESAKKEAAKEAREKVEAEFAESAKKERVATRKKEIADFCETMSKPENGKIIPAFIRSGIKEFMESLVEDETAISFSEGGEKQSKLDWFKGFVKDLPKFIDYSEFAGKDKDVNNGTAGEKLIALAKKKQKEGKGMSYKDAFAEVVAENKDLAIEHESDMKQK
jgi:hypothetical protein